MGCDFVFKGSVEDTTAQGKVVELVKGFFETASLLYEPSLMMVEPSPRAPRVTLRRIKKNQNQLWSRHRTEKVFSHPLNYYGIIPLSWGRFLPDFGQFVFDRENGGRLVTIRLLPNWYSPDMAKNLDRAVINEDGYYRALSERCAFGLMLCLIKIRYIPNLEVDDDFYIFRDTWQYLETTGYVSIFKNEAMDLGQCCQMLEEHFKTGHFFTDIGLFGGRR